MTGASTDIERAIGLWRDPSPAAVSNALHALHPLPGARIEDRFARIRPLLDRWQDPRYPYRAEAERMLARNGEFSPAMIEIGLAMQCRRIAPSAIDTVLCAGHPTLARGRPRTTAVIEAGNIPALALLDVTLSIIAGDPVAVKVPAAEPCTGLLFVESLHHHLGALPPPAAAFEWPGGDEARNAILLDWAEVVIVSGTDHTVASVSARHRSLRATRDALCRERGHRLSVAWVAQASWPLAEIAHRLAVDAALWDQEGCLSPQMAFVGPRVDAPALGRLVAEAFVRLERVLPRGRATLATKAAVRAFLCGKEARRLVDPSIEIHEGPAGRWAVVVDPSAPLEPSPLGRTLVLRPIAGEDEMLEVLDGASGKIQCLALDRDPATRPDLVAKLERLGVTRMCSIGRMQEPGPAWIGEEPDPGGGRILAVDSGTDGVWRSIGSAG